MDAISFALLRSLACLTLFKGYLEFVLIGYGRTCINRFCSHSLLQFPQTNISGYVQSTKVGEEAEGVGGEGQHRKETSFFVQEK